MRFKLGRGLCVFVAVMCAAGVAQAAAWHRVATAHRPSARYGMASAYDPVSRRLVLFGGFDGTNYLADTWVFDGKDWMKLSPPAAPPVRTSGGLAYDAASRKLVLFGGYDGAHWLGDTWLYDGKAGTWQQAQPAHNPRAGTGVSVFSDPRSGHAMVYGGFDGSQVVGYSNQTVRWTGSDWEVLSITPPSARSSPGYARDPRTHSVVLFDGLGSVNPYSTWLWQGNTWQQQAPAQMPPPRFSMGMACDGGVVGCVLYGGDQGGVSLGDSWAWDGAVAQWQPIADSAPPGTRELFTLVYDAARQRIVMFGGLRALNRKQVLLGDTWILQ